jgi:succinyl-diaminopimelate desuccinylase
MSNYQKLSRKYYDQALKNLVDWLKIDSVYDLTSISEVKPFGEGVYQALQFIGKIAEQDDFKVDYCDGYAVEISYGEGPLIGVYAHGDVVPISGEWKFPPFSGTIENGKVYGRGSSDDKGPAMASYYALKLLKDHQLIKGYQVRLVIGGNEERGSSCLAYYFHHLHKPNPVYGFTPDGEFPLIYGEKGITNYIIEGHIDLAPIIKIKAGVVANSVIDYAEAIIDDDVDISSKIEKHGYNYQLTNENGLTKLTVFGKSAHGSTPELGVNAGIQLLEILGEIYNKEVLATLVNQYKDPFGHGLQEYHHGPLLKETTYNVGLINYNDNQLSFTVNWRYPENMNAKDVLNRIRNKCPLSVRVLGENRLLLFNPDSPMVKTLLDVYQKETNDYTSPIITIGGGTYAKEAINTIAFGSNFPGKENYIHEPNEKIDIEDYHLSIAIYAHAIDALGKLNAIKV